MKRFLALLLFFVAAMNVQTLSAQTNGDVNNDGTVNEAVITICEDHRVQPLLDRLKKLDLENPMLGLRAFVWNIEQTI